MQKEAPGNDRGLRITRGALWRYIGVGLLAIVGALGLGFAVWSYIGHGPADEDLDRLGVLRTDTGYALFSCVERPIDFAELVTDEERFGEASFWSAQREPGSPGAEVISIQSTVDGYEVTWTNPVEDGRRYWIRSLRLAGGGRIQTGKPIDLAGLSVGDARSADGQVRTVEQIQADYPTCGLRAE